jgi:hypothetical protein
MGFTKNVWEMTSTHREEIIYDERLWGKKKCFCKEELQFQQLIHKPYILFILGYLHNETYALNWILIIAYI